MRLIENGPPELVLASPNDVMELHTLNSQWRKRLRLRELPFVVTQAGTGLIRLQAKNIAGFVQFGDIKLEILPKFTADATEQTGWRTALWNFLAFGEGLKLTDRTIGQFTEDDGLADLLAELFLQAVAATHVHGFPLGYKEANFTSRFLKGRLDPRSFGRLVPPTGKLTNLATRLTTNVEATQLLKWASGELAKVVRHPGRRQSLIQWRMLLPDVESKAPSRGIYTNEHRYPHLADAFAISQILLNGQSVNYGEGSAVLPGFLWNSDALFESVCYRLFTAAVRPFDMSVDKPTLPLASGDGISLSTIPDILIQRNGIPVLSLDAKYKHLAGSSPRTSDVYQAMAVGRVCKLRNVGLVYPSMGERVNSRSIKPQGRYFPETVHISEIGLEAFVNPEGIKSLQKKLTKWIDELLTESDTLDLAPT